MEKIIRSFSLKLNLGNYETADFFCSQEKEVDKGLAEKASEDIYIFCYQEVMKSVKAFQGRMRKLEKKSSKIKEDLLNKKVRSLELEELNFEANDFYEPDEVAREMMGLSDK